MITSTGESQLTLDPAIRDWVLFPIMLIMILVGVFRHHVTQFMATTPKSNLKAIRERYHFSSIPFASWSNLSTYANLQFFVQCPDFLRRKPLHSFLSLLPFIRKDTISQFPFFDSISQFL